MFRKGKQRINMHFLIQYEEQVLTPYSWISQADELITASKKLEPSIKKYWETAKNNLRNGVYSPPPGFKPKRLLQSTYFMLVAYAIENYLKAILIANSEAAYRSELRQTGRLRTELKTSDHNLVKLAEKSKFVFTNIELSLLSRLHRNSLWQGRYPVPAKADQLSPTVIHNGKVLFTPYLSPEDINNLT
ncbi:hypothetical protein ACFLVX_04965, partial [Chloroflexota bacterium]